MYTEFNPSVPCNTFEGIPHLGDQEQDFFPHLGDVMKEQDADAEFKQRTAFSWL